MKKFVFPLALLIGNVAWAVSPQQMLQGYEASSGKASAQRGEQFLHQQAWPRMELRQLPYRNAEQGERAHSDRQEHRAIGAFSHCQAFQRSGQV